MRTILLGVLGLAAVGGVGFWLFQDIGRKDKLFEAVRQGNLHRVDRLIAKGGDLEARDSLGQTALHSAVYSGEPAMVVFLLGRGAQTDARDSQGATPLHWAAINGKVENMRALLAHKADPDAQDNRKMTPLHWAATAFKINDSTKAYNAKLLLEAGARTNIRDHFGRTPLDYAKEKKNQALVNILETRRE